LRDDGRSNVFLDITTGLRDFDIVITILQYYLLTLGFLAAVFMIFTAFELWKFAGKTEGGIVLLFKYLFYLIPFIYIQLAPSAAMIATLGDVCHQVEAERDHYMDLGRVRACTDCCSRASF
jgi:hypothetical protein